MQLDPRNMGQQQKYQQNVERIDEDDDDSDEEEVVGP